MRWQVFILLSVFLISFASAVIPGDCDSSMISFWKFDGNPVDIFGGHDGEWNDSAAYNNFKVEQGASFSGNNKITIIDNIDLQFGSTFTIEMWFRSSSFSDSSLFSKGDYNIKLVNLSSAEAFVEASVGDVAIRSEVLDVDTPYHVAFIWDTSEVKLKLYINGVNVNETALAFAQSTADSLIVGERFVGVIDELAVYNSSLSTSIPSHYALSSNNKDYCDMSGAAGTSSITTDFSIRGCNFDWIDGSTIGVSSGECSLSPAAGEFYCGELEGQNWTTTEEGLGCVMGDSTGYGSTNRIYCCPEGRFCNKTGDNSYRCDIREKSCSEYSKEDPCVAAECWWSDVEEKCFDDSKDYSCEHYVDQDDCNEDEYFFATYGVGAEECRDTITCDNGTKYILNCSCAWHEDYSDDEKCALDKYVTQKYYSSVAGTLFNAFSCSVTNLPGDCIDGEQNVKWFSENEIEEGFDNIGYPEGIPDDCLTAAGCDIGSRIRACGEPIVRLPGFSLFSLFMSLFIIGIYCLFKKEDLNKEMC